MIAKVTDIINLLEQIAPSSLAEEWDNCGLQVGKADWPVKTVWIALDPVSTIIDAACNKNVDMLITHHPLIFRPLTSVDFNTPTGSIILKAALHKMSLFAAHTNLDSASGGINDVLARKIGLSNLKVMAPAKEDDAGKHGLGRVGDINKSVRLIDFANTIKQQLGIESVRFAGNPDLEINKAAVCAGSGSGLMKQFFSSGAQVYISGDLKYHDARDIEEAGLGMIDMGHFESEHLIVDILAGRLKKKLTETGFDITVDVCNFEKTPFTLL